MEGARTAMRVLVSNLQDEVYIEKDLIDLAVKVIENILLEHNLQNTEVSLVFVDDNYIQELNRDYRGIDKPTDVLSFAMNEGEDMPEEDIKILGDVVISLPRTKRQAKAYGHTFEREFIFLAIHGVLHLLGYDHLNDAEKEKMNEKERYFLTYYGLRKVSGVE